MKIKIQVQIHRLITDNQYQGVLCKSPNGTFSTNVLLGTPYNLYATVPQNIEPIKNGDLYIEITGLGKLLHRASEESLTGWNEDENSKDNFNRRCLKIIATTDKNLEIECILDSCPHSYKCSQTCFDSKQVPQFQQSIVKEYCENNGFDEATIDYDSNIVGIGVDVETTQGLKVNPNNTVNIQIMKDRVYTTIEVLDLLLDYRDYAWKNGLTLKELGKFRRKENI